MTDQTDVDQAQTTTPTEAVLDLRSLRKQPYRLLRALEAKFLRRISDRGQASGSSQQWMGLAFRCRGIDMVVSQTEIQEVMMMPEMTRVPGTRAWLMGLANVRGELLSMVDLGHFLGQDILLGERANRVLWVKNLSLRVGIVVDELYGFRRLNEANFSTVIPANMTNYGAWLDGQFEVDEQQWLVLSLSKLVRSDEFLQAAA